MARMTMIEAIRDALSVTMSEDPNVVVFGEDVGYFGGVFRCTQGLQQKFGRSRCFDTPINETGIIGAAIGQKKPCKHRHQQQAQQSEGIGQRRPA